MVSDDPSGTGPRTIVWGIWSGRVRAPHPMPALPRRIPTQDRFAHLPDESPFGPSGKTEALVVAAVAMGSFLVLACASLTSGVQVAQPRRRDWPCKVAWVGMIVCAGWLAWLTVMAFVNGCVFRHVRSTHLVAPATVPAGP